MKGLADRELKNRLQALKNLIQKNPKKIKNGWINLHVHTNESFSVRFSSRIVKPSNGSSLRQQKLLMKSIFISGITSDYTVTGYH